MLAIFSLIITSIDLGKKIQILLIFKFKYSVTHCNDLLLKKLQLSYVILVLPLVLIRCRI